MTNSVYRKLKGYGDVNLQALAFKQSEINCRCFSTQ